MLGELLEARKLCDSGRFRPVRPVLIARRGGALLARIADPRGYARRDQDGHQQGERADRDLDLGRHRAALADVDFAQDEHDQAARDEADAEAAEKVRPEQPQWLGSRQDECHRTDSRRIDARDHCHEHHRAPHDAASLQR
jgi:hypothetical protein